MKTLSIFSKAVVVACALVPTWMNAQTVDRTTGQEIVTPKPPPKFVALLIGNGDNAKIQGTLKFNGDLGALTVNGRIEGLEPGRRYQLMIRPLAGDTVVVATSGVTQKAPDGSPAAGQPQVPNPNAGPPDAGSPQAPPPDAGQPNGEDRPGTPGRGTQGSPVGGHAAPSPAERAKLVVLGGIEILTADPTGATNIQSATLTHMDIGQGPTGIQGCVISLQRLPANDREVAREVATAVVAIAKTEEKP